MNFKALTLTLACALALNAAQAQSLSVTPDTKSVKLGDTFSLNIEATGFLKAVTGGGFELSFNAGVLHLDSVVIPSSWEFYRSGGLIDNASGTLSDAGFASFSSPKSGDFLTGTLNFSAIGVGTSAVTLTANALQPFAEEDNTLPAVVFKSGQVNVAPSVPEPSSLALALAGIGLAGWSARRRQHRG
jgi:hypothetical protein